MKLEPKTILQKVNEIHKKYLYSTVVDAVRRVHQRPETGMKSSTPSTLVSKLTCCAILAGAVPFASAAEKAVTPAPDAAALLVLDTARRAYNDGKSDASAERFREFL